MFLKVMKELGLDLAVVIIMARSECCITVQHYISDYCSQTHAWHNLADGYPDLWVPIDSPDFSEYKLFRLAFKRRNREGEN